jgi:hypothetical protein
VPDKSTFHAVLLLCRSSHAVLLLCTSSHAVLLLCTSSHVVLLLCTPSHAVLLLCRSPSAQSRQVDCCHALLTVTYLRPLPYFMQNRVSRCYASRRHFAFYRKFLEFTRVPMFVKVHTTQRRHSGDPLCSIVSNCTIPLLMCGTYGATVAAYPVGRRKQRHIGTFSEELSLNSYNVLCWANGETLWGKRGHSWAVQFSAGI